jgi:hypothetical protein
VILNHDSEKSNLQFGLFVENLTIIKLSCSGIAEAVVVSAAIRTVFCPGAWRLWSRVGRGLGISLTAKIRSSLSTDEDFYPQAAPALDFPILKSSLYDKFFQTATWCDSPDATISRRFDFEIRRLYGPTFHCRRHLGRRCPNPSWPILSKWPLSRSLHVQ